MNARKLGISGILLNAAILTLAGVAFLFVLISGI